METYTENPRARSRQNGFAENLEKRAGQLTQDSARGSWDSSAESFLERQIAMALHQIKQVKALHQHLRRSLVREECYVGTDLLRIDRLKYPIYNYQRQRAWLKDKLHSIERERRQLALSEEQTLRTLHDRLFELLQSHRHLSIENGD